MMEFNYTNVISIIASIDGLIVDHLHFLPIFYVNNAKCILYFSSANNVTKCLFETLIACYKYVVFVTFK